MLYKKGVLKNFPKFTGKTCARASCNFIKKETWHRYFPVNFAKFLRTPTYFEEHLQQLLLGFWIIRITFLRILLCYLCWIFILLDLLKQWGVLFNCWFLARFQETKTSMIMSIFNKVARCYFTKYKLHRRWLISKFSEIWHDAQKNIFCF